MGSTYFTDFTLAIMKIGASSAESSEILELPLVKANLKSTLLIDGINQREDVMRRLNKCNNSQFHNNGILTEVILKSVDENCAILPPTSGPNPKPIAVMIELNCGAICLCESGTF